jgi:hypothetical protein
VVKWKVDFIQMPRAGIAGHRSGKALRMPTPHKPSPSHASNRADGSRTNTKVTQVISHQLNGGAERQEHGGIVQWTPVKKRYG